MTYLLTVVLPDSRSKKCENDVLGRLLVLGECRPEVLLPGALLPLGLQLLEVVVVLQQLWRVVPDQSEEIVGPGRLQNILKYVVIRDQELDSTGHGHLHVVIRQFSGGDGSPLVARVVFDGGDATGGHDVIC